MLAQHWKPQDGGDLMLGLHFSVFPRKRKPASHNVRFVVSCAVMFLFSLFFSFSSFQICTASGKKIVKKLRAVMCFGGQTERKVKVLWLVHENKLKLDEKSLYLLGFFSQDPG